MKVQVKQEPIASIDATYFVRRPIKVLLADIQTVNAILMRQEKVSIRKVKKGIKKQ